MRSNLAKEIPAVFHLRCGPYSVASVCARLLVLLPVLLLSTPSTALTQRATPVWESAARPNLPDLEPGRANLTDATLPPLQLDTYPGTYWKEGALIGAIAIGVVGFLIASRICGDSHDSDHCSTERFGGAAIGTGVGFGLGTLVGSRFRKGP